MIIILLLLAMYWQLVTTVDKFKNAKFKDRSHKAALGQTLLRGFGGRRGAQNMTAQQVKEYVSQRLIFIQNIVDLSDQYHIQTCFWHEHN